VQDTKLFSLIYFEKAISKGSQTWREEVKKKNQDVLGMVVYVWFINLILTIFSLWSAVNLILSVWIFSSL